MTEPAIFDDIWYLIFSKGGHRSKWLPWLKVDFSHVRAIKELDEGWIEVNPCRERTEINFRLKYDYPSIYCFMAENEKLIRIPVHAKRGHTRGRFTFVSCVEVVKSIIGIGGATVWTPHQLYKVIKNEQRKVSSKKSSKAATPADADPTTTGTGKNRRDRRRNRPPPCIEAPWRWWS